MFKGWIRLLITILFGWLRAIPQLIALILRRFFKKGGNRDEKGRHYSKRRCIPLPHSEHKRPDPLIYDQYYLSNLGFAVTWDNPDVQLNLNGSPVSSNMLLPDTTYDVVAQIWNSSPDAPVMQMPVHFSYLDFGMGTVNIPIGDTKVDLGVKGGPGCPAYATMKWKTPDVAGHYCLQILLQPVDDSNPANNLGQENTNVAKAQSPAAFSFKLRNNTRHQQTYRFEVDSYKLTAPDPCGTGLRDEKAKADQLQRHKAGAQSIAAGWQIMIEPKAPTLAPEEEMTISVLANPPEGFKGTEVFNVNAFHSEGMAGGVTLTVIVE